MTLINSTVLLGLVLAAVPVILHLVMRAKPKRIEFPALRLLKARRTSNSRRMQLRHFLLLLLRALLIAVLVLAIARPSLPAANYGLRWWEWVALAVTAFSSAAAYFWLVRKTKNAMTLSVDAMERRNKMRLWCVLAGLVAAMIVVGVPWGVRVRAEIASPRNDSTENVPVAAVFLIDTSISMKYRFENKTRLEVARSITEKHLGRFPANSRAAISGLIPDEDIVFQADLSGAASRLETLETTAVPESFNRRLKAAIQAQIDDRKRVQEEAGTGESSDLFAREIYIVTDFSKTAWQEGDENGLADLMQLAEWLQIYVVDVSLQQPVNMSLSNLTLSEETSIAGRDLLLTMTVSSTSPVAAVSTVETNLVDSSGVEARFGAPQIVKVENGSVQIQSALRITGSEPFLEGFVRLVHEDPLGDDNVRYFSCGVRPKPRVLLVSDRVEETKLLLDALEAIFAECRAVATAQMGQQTLANYDVICLVNCQRPDESLWGNLRTFVGSGGGLFVVAGSNRIQPAAWAVPAAQSLLPATPIRITKFLNEPSQLRLTSEQHPILRAFNQDELARVELASNLFDRCWAVEPAEDSITLMTLSGPGDRPALMERKAGQGRCLMFTSAMDNLRDGGSQWNNLVSSWSFLMLTDKVLQHLTGANSFKRNFIAGETIDLPVPVSQRFEQYLLRRPGLRQTRETLPADESSLLLIDAVDPGLYRVKPFESQSPFDAAFAVNCRDAESDLTKIPDEELQKIVGTEHVAIVHDPNELQRAVRVGRLGVEIFPVLMGLLILLFCAEHLMANYFYDEQPSENRPSAQPA